MNPIFWMLIAFVTVNVWSQNNTSLRGEVADQTGALVPKAHLTLTNAATGWVRETESNDSGMYVFPQIAPGAYRLIVEVLGFKRYEANGLQLLVNSPAQLNVVLEIGVLTESVVVNDESPLLNAVDASLGAVITEHQVKELPIEARDLAALYSIQPGVVYLGNRPDMDINTDTRSGAVNGAHSDQSNILLDGVDVNDQTRGYAFTSVLRVTPDAMQEVRVATTNYDVEAGRSSGAQVSIITKSGTNDLHGSAYEFHRNTATSANDYFVKQTQLHSGQEDKPPKLIRNIFGASVGGPIKKDRAFVFLNYEGRRDSQANSTLRVVPSASLRQGIIQYPYCTVQLDANGNCPGAVALQTLTRQDLTAMDPLHIGPSQTMLTFFQSYPLPNDVGTGDGLNYSGFRFAAPVKNRFDTYIGRVDYLLTKDGKQTLFWRGNLQNDVQDGAPYLPGDSPLVTIIDRSKGFVLGNTAVLTPSLVNNLRWGFTRHSEGTFGNSTQPFIQFRGLNDSGPNAPFNFTYSHAFTAPVHNLVDDLSWKKGNHSVTMGTTIRLMRNPRTSLADSFSYGVTNASLLPAAGIANTSTFMDPALSGFPAVLSSFNNSYDSPLIALLGSVSEGDAIYNYNREGKLLPQGTPVKRRFGANELEFYLQDSFRIKPNLTITYGVRYELLSPPWETTGLQVAPQLDMGNWFLSRAQNMNRGIPSNADPKVQFDLAGPANGKKGYYNWDYNNFAPRIGIAFLPRATIGPLHRLFGEDKLSIRAGFGVVYDRIGAGLLNSFDQNGSFGLSTQIRNPSTLSLEMAPRLTDLHIVPESVLAPPPNGGFPQTPPDIPGNIAWGLDNSLRTPYSYQLAFTISRELPSHTVFDASYVGHLAHKLLVQEDLAMPLNLVDPATGIDYFHAATRFTQLGAAKTPVSAIAPELVGPTASYWTDLFPLLASSSGTALQNAYAVMNRFLFNETTGLLGLDLPRAEGGICDNGCNRLGPYTYFNRQYSSLYAWRSIGNSSYNALQLALRKRFSRGLQFDLNYTFSKSLDLSSDAERIRPWGGLLGQIINSWDYKALRSVSDFDTTHQINASWVMELPFGNGRRLGRHVNRTLDAVIRGWQLTGIYRWSTGFPIGVKNGLTWPTNWQLGGYAVPIRQLPSTGVFKKGDGTVNIFENPAGAITSFRHDYPGESGARNVLRGDGVFGWDLGLSKRWKVPFLENHTLQFRCEVFNVPNSVRFDVQSIKLSLDNANEFGKYTNLLSNPRIIQFALRYEF
jgi:hypothetical protein